MTIRNSELIEQLQKISRSLELVSIVRRVFSKVFFAT